MATTKKNKITKELKDYTKKLIKASLAEDVGTGDITTRAIVPPKQTSVAIIKAKEDMVLAGIFMAEEAFREVDRKIKFKALYKDGDKIKKGSVIAKISGSTAKILEAERVALNFLQLLSGVATLTSKFVGSIKSTKALVLDTRKTTPCLRFLEKYAVRCGGGVNHRLGLFDAILIKDNHIKSAGNITKAIKLVREKIPDIVIEVEVKNLKEVKEALRCNAEIILLDNMTTTNLKKAVTLINHRALTEASGGVTLDNILKIAKTGVDYISAGALTHSAKASDISLLIK